MPDLCLSLLLLGYGRKNDLMTSIPTPPHLTRRDFLRLAGVTAGAALAGPLLGVRPAQAAATSTVPLPGAAPVRVGVLLPPSTNYPDLGRNFLAGLCLAAGKGTLDVVVRETGSGAAHPYEVVQQLVSRDGVQRIVGMIDPLTLAALRGFLAAHGARVLAVSLGENLPPANAADPAVTYYGAGLVQTALAFGGWAAHNWGRTAVLAASCYDSGYDAFAAFRLGFERAGGQVLHTAITHLPSDEPDLAGVMRTIATARPAFVYAAYCGTAALDWVRAYATAGLSGTIPLVGSPFLTDETLLAGQGQAALGIYTALPVAGDGADTRTFADLYQASTGRPADALALLGGDTARLLTGQAVGSGLIALRTVQAQAGGLHNTVLGRLARPDLADKALEPLRTGLHSGWLHPYLAS